MGRHIDESKHIVSVMLHTIQNDTRNNHKCKKQLLLIYSNSNLYVIYSLSHSVLHTGSKIKLWLILLKMDDDVVTLDSEKMHI
jgi:hypothetical protein